MVRRGSDFGYNTIYAAGSSANQELGLSAKGGSGHLRFHTNENERMRITSSGNVGIGTSSPTEKLHVTGNVNVTGNIHMTGSINVDDVVHPTLEAPYTNAGSPMPPAGYYKDKENRVYLNGSVTSNSNPFYATLFTLPPGYRPAGSQNYIVYNEGGVARVLILSIGEVVIVSGTAGIVSLDQISFRAVQ